MGLERISACQSHKWLLGWRGLGVKRPPSLVFNLGNLGQIPVSEVKWGWPFLPLAVVVRVK